MKLKTLSVTDVNSYLKRSLDNDFILNNLSVKGEISNLKFHSSGHIYFSLKDKESKINAVMFRSDAENLNFLLENGMEVTIKGRLSVYIKDGSYQLYCKEASKFGIGELFEKYEAMKKELENEGIFDLAYKRKIKKFPTRIGVITSPTGAAIKDIIRVIQRRNKSVDIVLYPAKVQGIAAEETLIDGIRFFNNEKSVDTIIIGRGGGSIEELWAFNSRELAYEIYNSSIPVISGVGHETDFTICDFASDIRAATPTAAGEIAVSSILEEIENLDKIRIILKKDIERIVQFENEKLERCKRVLESNNPKTVIKNKAEDLRKMKVQLDRIINSKIELEKEKIAYKNSILTNLNPLNVLSRGYSVINDKNGNIINKVSELKKDQEIEVNLSDGKITGNFEVLK
ncbi:MAG: exodeoxyribonuclease VII large subunit [Sarcina sp.]